MKRENADNINSVIGWLCGAVFLVAPVAALAYALRRRWRPAFQAAMICVISLSCIVGARARMLAAGVQHKRPEWIGLNLLVLVVVPLLAMAIAWAISWPSSHGAKSTERGT
jgi:DUF1365 family protein